MLLETSSMRCLRSMKALACTLILLALTTNAYAWDGDINPDDYLNEKTVKKLQAGKVVQFSAPSESKKEGQEGGAFAFIYIKKSAETVYEILSAFDKQPKYLHRVVRIKIIEENEDTALVKQTIKVPVYGEVSYHLRYGIERDRLVLTYTLDDTRENDIAATSGRWILVPKGDNACIVAYTAYADTGRKIPKILEKWIMNRDLPAIMKSVKKRAEEGADKK